MMVDTGRGRVAVMYMIKNVPFTNSNDTSPLLSQKKKDDYPRALFRGIKEKNLDSESGF